MYRLRKQVIWMLASFAVSVAFVQKAYCNINAIDFSQVHYSAQLQADIDFLKDNEQSI